MTEEEARAYKPRVVILNDQNEPVEVMDKEVHAVII